MPADTAPSDKQPVEETEEDIEVNDDEISDLAIDFVDWCVEEVD